MQAFWLKTAPVFILTMQACWAENNVYLYSYHTSDVWPKRSGFTLTMQAYLAENNVCLYCHHTSMFGRKCLPLSLLSQCKHAWPKKCLPLLSQCKYVWLKIASTFAVTIQAFWPKMSTFTLRMQACLAQNVYFYSHHASMFGRK